MDENIDVPFLLLWSCKGSSNCLNLDQAVLHVRCLPWLRTESWSTKKMSAMSSSGARVAQEPQKVSKMTSLAAHAKSWGLNIEDDVIYFELKSCCYYYYSFTCDG